MNDTIIAKTIPKIQNNLLLFLGTLFFVGFLTFIALIEGIHIATVKLGNVKIEQLYLKWEHKFHIKASTITIEKVQENEPINLEKISSLPEWLRIGYEWIDSIAIDSIRYGGFTFKLYYNQDTNSEFSLAYKDIQCQSRFILTPSALQMETEDCPQFSNKIVMDLDQQTFYGVLHINLPETPKLTIRYDGNKDHLAYNGAFQGPLHTLEPIAKFLDLDQNLIPWLTTAMRYDSLQIDDLSGSISFSDPSSSLKNLKANGNFKNARYQFDKALAPIMAEYVSISFENSKLLIRPFKGHFYSLPTQKSYLDIDFAPKEIMLNAFIKTNQAVLNHDILDLLKHYDITVPLKQLDGICNVDLNLSINLHTEKVKAAGRFIPSSSTLSLDTFIISTDGGSVSLDNSIVTFTGFNADYMNIAKGKVKGYYDALNETGKISIQINQIHPIRDNQNFYLLTDENPLQIDYRITPKIDSLRITPSKWYFMGETLHVDGMNFPYGNNQGIMQIPSTKFSIKNKIQGQVEGKINTLSHKADFDLLINSVQIPPFQLTQKPLSIHAQFDQDQIHFSTVNTSKWSINQLPLSLSKMDAILDNNNIIFNNIDFSSDDLFSGSVTSTFDIMENRGKIIFNNLQYIEPKLKPIIESDDKLSFDFMFKNNNLEFHSDILNTDFKTENNGWKIEIADISRLSKHSPILKYYDINKGRLDIFYVGAENRYVFNGDLIYPYKLMELNNESFSKYHFLGTYQNGKYNLRINDRIVLTYDGIVKIKGRNTGINIPELARFLSDHPSSGKTSNSPSQQKIYISLKDSRLFINRHHKIISDTIDAVSIGDKFNATLVHGHGQAKLAMEKEDFYIEGNNFNDYFMEELFHYSDFIGGNLSLEAKGRLENFEGIVKVEKTTLKKHKVLNNVLAFINTVPSLATFSLPNYNSQGLPITEAYSHFNYSGSVIKMDHFALLSPEIKIYGEGNADISKDTVKGMMTLKTDIGSKLSKIPMVGYILFGDDGSVSTTLTIKGKLSDPEVETAFAKEILTAPFNILKRTLVYPFLWMMDNEKEK